MKPDTTIALILALSLPVGALAQTPPSMRIAGNFSANTKHVDNIEKPFFTGLPKAIGGNFFVNYKTIDVLGGQAAEAPRPLRPGTFDGMSGPIGVGPPGPPFFPGGVPIRVSAPP